MVVKAGKLDLGNLGVVVGVAMVIPRAVLGDLRVVVPENLVVLLGLEVLKPVRVAAGMGRTLDRQEDDLRPLDRVDVESPVEYYITVCHVTLYAFHLRSARI